MKMVALSIRLGVILIGQFTNDKYYNRKSDAVRGQMRYYGWHNMY